MYRILLVDDDVKNLKATQAFLKANGYDTVTTPSPTNALELVQADQFAVVLLDYNMPEMMGDQLAIKIQEVSPHQQLAMFSCDLSREALKNTIFAKVGCFIEKSMSNDEFVKTIEGLCAKYEMAFRTIRPGKNKSENRILIESAGMVGQSEVLANTVRTIRQVSAANDTSVFINGESGAGKEMVARAVHNLSSRAKGPFIAVNCTAIPSNLFESELFGHARGAFTGANENKDGKFKLANGGTIFLDEIGDMPLESQAKLLRVIQERVIDPVGSKSSQKIDVRIITATNRNLDEMVVKKEFREDLLFRIRVVEINVPALRHRPEDIEPLVEHFTSVYNKKNGRRKYFLRTTLNVLKNYPWPGNIRELAAVVEKHIILHQGADNVIRPEDIDRKYYDAPRPTDGLKLEQVFLENEKRVLSHLEETVDKADNNKAEAARWMGITRSHLNHLLADTKKRIQSLQEEKSGV